MKYSKKFLRQLLLHLQSQNYPAYKDASELDVLLQLLNAEAIVHYHEIEWMAFQEELLPGTRFQDFTNRIIPRAECIRVLTFIRDNAEESLGKNTNEELVRKLEDTCSRLIYENIQQSARDQFHGEFASMPRPNLQEIAAGRKAPKLNAQDQIIANHMPSYPHELEGFGRNYIVQVAHTMVEQFRGQIWDFDRMPEDCNKPTMSQKQYCSPIRDELIRATNRYLYFENGPIYQVMWAMCVLLRLPGKKRTWWEEKFSEGLLRYLDCTRYFKNTKAQMDIAIDEIVQLTQPRLSLFEDELSPIIHHRTTEHHAKLDDEKLIKQLISAIQKEDSDRPVAIHIHSLEQFHNNPLGDSYITVEKDGVLNEIHDNKEVVNNK